MSLQLLPQLLPKVTSTSSACASLIFVVYAEDFGRRFLAHSKILSLSPTLRKIVEGDWKDSKDGVGGAYGRVAS